MRETNSLCLNVTCLIISVALSDSTNTLLYKRGLGIGGGETIQTDMQTDKQTGRGKKKRQNDTQTQIEKYKD